MRSRLAALLLVAEPAEVETCTQTGVFPRIATHLVLPSQCVEHNWGRFQLLPSLLQIFRGRAGAQPWLTLPIKRVPPRAGLPISQLQT